MSREAKNPFGGAKRPSDERELRFDDVKATYSQVEDVDVAKARARARFHSDLKTAPVFRTTRKRRILLWSGLIGGAIPGVAATLVVVVMMSNGAFQDRTKVDPAHSQSPSSHQTTPSASGGTSTTAQPTPETATTSGSVPQVTNYRRLTREGEFLTADKSVMCVVDDSGAITCAARNTRYDPGPKPSRCGTLDYGASVSAAPDQKAQFDCTSDYLFSDVGPVLAVGVELIGPGGLVCSTTEKSVTCHYGNNVNRFVYSENSVTLP